MAEITATQLEAVNLLKPVLGWWQGPFYYSAGSSWLTVEREGKIVYRLRGRQNLRDFYNLICEAFAAARANDGKGTAGAYLAGDNVFLQVSPGRLTINKKLKLSMDGFIQRELRDWLGLAFGQSSDYQPANSERAFSFSQWEEGLCLHLIYRNDRSAIAAVDLTAGQSSELFKLFLDGAAGDSGRLTEINCGRRSIRLSAGTRELILDIIGRDAGFGTTVSRLELALLAAELQQFFNKNGAAPP